METAAAGGAEPVRPWALSRDAARTNVPSTPAGVRHDQSCEGTSGPFGPVDDCGRPLTDDPIHGPLLAGYGVTVPVAGSDVAGLPFQSPAMARSDHGVAVPRVSPVNSLLVTDSGRVRVVEPTVSCQPVAPAGA